MKITRGKFNCQKPTSTWSSENDTFKLSYVRDILKIGMKCVMLENNLNDRQNNLELMFQESEIKF